MQSLIVPCPGCRSLNRVPQERLADVPVCATCRVHLFGKPVECDEAAFDRIVAATNLPVVADFWAGWCGPCRQMAPRFHEAAGELAGRVVFLKVDTEAVPGVAARFGIQSIPTMVLLQGGNEVRRISGALPKDQIVRWVTVG